MKHASCTRLLLWVIEHTASAALRSSYSFFRLAIQTASGVIRLRALADKQSRFSLAAASFAIWAYGLSNSGEKALYTASSISQCSEWSQF